MQYNLKLSYKKYFSTALLLVILTLTPVCAISGSKVKVPPKKIANIEVDTLFGYISANNNTFCTEVTKKKNATPKPKDEERLKLIDVAMPDTSSYHLSVFSTIISQLFYTINNVMTTSELTAITPNNSTNNNTKATNIEKTEKQRLWTSFSGFFNDKTSDDQHDYHETRNISATFGFDSYIPPYNTFGLCYSLNMPKTIVHGALSKLNKIEDDIQTHLFASYIYTSVSNMHITSNFLYSENTHKPKYISSKIIKDVPIFDNYATNVLAGNLAVDMFLESRFINLTVNGEIGFTKITVNKHNNKFTILDKNNKPLNLTKEQNNNLLYYIVGLSFKGKINLQDAFQISCKLGMNYKSTFLRGDNSTTVQIVGNDPKTKIEPELRKPSKNYLNLNAGLALQFSQMLNIELDTKATFGDKELFFSFCGILSCRF